MKPILMSSVNPTGHKLEDLLPRLRAEISNKTDRLVGDDRPISQTLIRNNHLIMQLLAQAEAIQRESLRELDRIGPDQGPTGTPRIGVGSPGGPAAIHKDGLTR